MKPKHLYEVYNHHCLYESGILISEDFYKIGETMAVSEAQAINNVLYRSNNQGPSYRYDEDKYSDAYRTDDYIASLSGNPPLEYCLFHGKLPF